MPRQLNATEELKTAYAHIKTNPSHRFKVIAGITAITYAKVLERMVETGKPLSHTIDAICGEYFAMKDAVVGGGLPLDTANRDRLKALTTLWNCTPEEAIRRLLERTVTQVIQDETSKWKKEKEQLDSLMQHVG